MSEAKFKRLIMAVTAGAVMLLTFLLSVMIYQLCALGAERAKEKELMAVIAEYEALIDEDKDTLKARSDRRWIERRARELGYVYSDDVGLEKK